MEIAFSIGLVFTTLMVVVGLVGEYRKGDWWKRNLHIFEMLVVLGVAGEMLAESGAIWYSLKVHALDESDIVAARKMANDSALEAAGLGVTVDTLKSFVAQKQSEADDQFKALRRFVASEDVRNASVIAELNKDRETLDKARDDAVASVATANKILGEMTSELNAQRAVQQQMLAIVTPRDLSDIQATRIVAALKPFSGQSWTVTTYWDSKEPLALTNKIFAVLKAANWQYDDEGSKSMMLGGVEGVLVYVHPEASAKAKSAANALIDALNAEHISSTLKYQNNPGHPNDKLYINIGSKP